MTTTGIRLFQLLKPRIGKQEANTLITYVNTTVNDSNKELRDFMQMTFVTKQEFKEEISAVRSELRTEIASVRVEIAKVETKVVEVKSDILRWVFAFFITTVLAILGLYLKK